MSFRLKVLLAQAPLAVALLVVALRGGAHHHLARRRRRPRSSTRTTAACWPRSAWARRSRRSIAPRCSTSPASSPWTPRRSRPTRSASSPSWRSRRATSPRPASAAAADALRQQLGAVPRADRDPARRSTPRAARTLYLDALAPGFVAVRAAADAHPRPQPGRDAAQERPGPHPGRAHVSALLRRPLAALAARRPASPRCSPRACCSRSAPCAPRSIASAAGTSAPARRSRAGTSWRSWRRRSTPWPTASTATGAARSASCCSRSRRRSRPSTACPTRCWSSTPRARC